MSTATVQPAPSSLSSSETVTVAEIRGSCLQTLIQVLDAKDPASRLSAFRAAKLASSIARLFGRDEEYARRVELGGMLHDIGKLGIPDFILQKRGTLSDEEIQRVRFHTKLGVSILSPLLGSEPVILAIVLHHHERWDGAGYPDGLKGNDIPLEARLMCAADAFIAMVSERPYRKALSVDEALYELQKGSGEQFDPQVITALMNLPDGVADNIATLTPSA